MVSCAHPVDNLTLFAPPTLRGHLVSKEKKGWAGNGADGAEQTGHHLGPNVMAYGPLPSPLESSEGTPTPNTPSGYTHQDALHPERYPERHYLAMSS